jgi:hypothetical protein
MKMKSMASALIVAMLSLAPAAHAQWGKVHDRAVPRARDGVPDLSAPVPRAPDGKPDLSGVWLPDTEPLPPGVKTVEGDLPFPRYMMNIAADFKPEEFPITPWAAGLLAQRAERGGQDSPLAHCKPTGMPFASSVPLPYKIVQTPRLILVLYEDNTDFRQIFLDRRKPVDNPVPRWMGYSTGHWDGDELVVRTVGLTDQSWLDARGHPHSGELRVTERFRRRDVGHLEIETTIDDPKAYTQPITYTVKTTLVADEDLLEYFCTENEKDAQHYR